MSVINLVNESPAFELSYEGSILKVYGNIFDNKFKSNDFISLSNFILDPEVYLKGDFCFVLNLNDNIYLGSSRSATHPIYFRKNRKDVVFSLQFSEVVEASKDNFLSSEAAFQFITYEYVTDPLTLVEGVYKVPSSNILTIDKDLNFSLSEFSSQISLCDESENSINNFKESVYKAHERRVSNNKDNILLLSGGVDSCVSAIVLKDVIKDSQLHCFTFSTLNSEQDEFNEAKYTADYLGLNVDRVIVDPNKSVDLEDLVYKSNFFYPGAIMISAIAQTTGGNSNFFACQDTRLHTPALNPLDKFIFSSGQSTRNLFSLAMNMLPDNIIKNNILNKVISRGRLSENLPEYIHSLFFHKHDLNIGSYVADKNFSTSLENALYTTFSDKSYSSRQVYNQIVKLAWHRQYSDDIQYLLSTTKKYNSDCQMPWYDEELAFLSATLPMNKATKFVKGRAGHSSKAKKVNKFILREAFSGLLPNEILFRDKAVCVTNHLYLKGCYKPYIEAMNINSSLFNTSTGRQLKFKQLFNAHYKQYMNYQIQDYTKAVEMQNIVALELYCKVYNLK